MYVYLDNNASTMMPQAVKESMIKWCNKGNPSSSHAAAKSAQSMMVEFKKYIQGLCGCKYTVMFTSGASEANCTLIHAIVSAYSTETSAVPHIVASAVEHKSILDMLNSYVSRGIITITLVKPSVSGHIIPADIENAIIPQTCLVCVMHANNETGAINDIRAIGAIAHKRNIPYHCDTVQTFGKFPIQAAAMNVDSYCISFHKFQGPPGVGALVIKQDLWSGYKLQPSIFGSQNGGLRGGTENLPGIGASLTALRITMENRLAKNNTMLQLKKYIIGEIANRLPTRTYAAYTGDKLNNGRTPRPSFEIVFFSIGDTIYLPNTILLSVVKRTGKTICNGEIKSALESRNVIISVGSACNTDSKYASHVLYSMGADELIRKGALRISLGDQTAIADAKKFVKEFITVLKEVNT